MAPGTIAIVGTTAPLVAFLLSLIFFRSAPRLAAGTALSAGAVSLLSAVVLIGQAPIDHLPVAPWLEIGGFPLAFGFLLDGTNLVMGLVVALISLTIQVYSTGYMASDPGKSRYFAFMALFAWSMLSFVYAASLLQMFIFWELVGLASFLLIGFWYEKPAAAAAARKAFIMTRVGDIGLFLGLILLLQATNTLDIARINDPDVLQEIPSARLTLIGLLFLCGVAGKSAQFPLHTWLPDAMEGPTPVSALLHSATMVAAGVFLVARFHPLLMAAPSVAPVILAVAIFTAILSATIAMVSRDIKRVLAYSSISQLSFMLMGLAAGSFFAGFFHLITHAFFKALLFLCAGAYIHHHHTNDMVAIGRAGGRAMRWTTAGLVAGGAALAGIPPFSGFFSKELVLGAVSGTGSKVAVGAVFLAVFLTAYYTFRMIFLVTRPNPQGELQPEEPAATPHHGSGGDAPWSMRGPIVVLTALAVVAGGLGPWIAGHVLAQGGAHGASSHGAAHSDGFHVDIAGAAPAVIVSLLGVALAWIEFGRRNARQRGFVAAVPVLRTLFVRKWFIDDFYDAVVAGFVAVLSRTCAFVEAHLLDAGADAVAAGTKLGGRFMSWIQSGRIQPYIAGASIVLAICSFLIGVRRG